MRGPTGVDSLELDDLYNNLIRVFENDVKRFSTADHPLVTQNKPGNQDRVGKEILGTPGKKDGKKICSAQTQEVNIVEVNAVSAVGEKVETTVKPSDRFNRRQKGIKGPTWLFDLDYLTDSMNYQPVRSGNQANKHAGPQEANHNAGTKDNIDAGDSEKEDKSAHDYFVLPIWSSYSSTVKRSTEKDAGEAPNKHPDLKTDEKPIDKEDQVFLDELERLK
ncbi:hypothetical protein Tco_0030878, partial [Tanacetum coccineum]